VVILLRWWFFVFLPIYVLRLNEWHSVLFPQDVFAYLSRFCYARLNTFVDPFVQLRACFFCLPVQVDIVVRDQVMVQKCLQEGTFPILWISGPLTILQSGQNYFDFPLRIGFVTLEICFLWIFNLHLLHLENDVWFCKIYSDFKMFHPLTEHF
jgi:hypothetical protein